MTDEHILSDFLHSILPDAEYREESFDGMMEVDGKLKYIVIPVRNTPGAVHTKKAHCVCRDCNTGWMQRIVSAASYWAKPLVEGRPIVLNEIQQRQLASWIALSAISANWIGKDRTKITQSDRDYMVAKGVPPPHWSIFIGRWDGPIRVSAMSQSPLIASHPKNGSIVFTMHSIASIQGCLYTLVHTPDPVIPFPVPDSIYHPYLVRLWPITRRWVIEDKTLRWPLGTAPITGQFYEGAIAHALPRVLRHRLSTDLSFIIERFLTI
ncbi:MAG: hypothetical protein Q8L53_01270 [Aestuariivirga sp.]|nr:hypothetical protein [Aestuariivirga sp.]